MPLPEEMVNKLVKELNHRLQEETDILKGTTIRRCGTAYENLTVGMEEDFDLILVLGEPFVSSNFKITREERSKYRYYSLNKKRNVNINKKKNFCSNRRNLNSEALRIHIFERLEQILRTITVQGVSVTSIPQSPAMKLNLRSKKGRTIEIDITPQIALSSWDECPGLVPLYTLPQCLKDYIEGSDGNGSPVLYFTPAAPRTQRSPSHPICNMVGCYMMEKKFFREETAIWDMVRLAKLVKDNRNWTTEYGLKSFHLKRLAIKNANTLRSMTPWNGYKALLKCIDRELKACSGLTDCFVEKQFIYYEKHLGKVRKLRRALTEAQQLTPEDLKAMV
ncbi:uncharacterized protein LOC121855580 isoform X2 [Homarus americanus]|uniref:uncharacterized protein LOC121855580 isoform X2 n=1 Tax=Homarus americanus TaxID=6706 RepID=UPI001C4459AC|nr:uncharacterized protein LOC121855580 isoform X2 [Homarus americanus]XP_042206530.1 uncharacterized protein LOC121855580 isoform X2 [Homarus americanus]